MLEINIYQLLFSQLYILGSTQFVAIIFRATEKDLPQKFMGIVYPLAVMSNFLLSKSILKSSSAELNYYLLRFVESEFCTSSFALIVYAIPPTCHQERVPSELLDLFSFRDQAQVTSSLRAALNKIPLKCKNFIFTIYPFLRSPAIFSLAYCQLISQWVLQLALMLLQTQGDVQP